MVMRIPAISLLVCLISFSAHSQKPPIKFGDVPPDQLKMTKYDKDSSASAVILADYGESSIQYTQDIGFTLNFVRLTRIKILSKEGLVWANFSIPLYHDNGKDETLSGLKAVTYNLENGKQVESKVKNDGIFKEKYSDNQDYMKVTLPNVKEGSVIEIAYKVNSDFLFNFWDWEFQSTIPVIWSEYRAMIPEYFFYDKYMQGYVSLMINEETKKSSSITITTKERGEGLNSKTTFDNERIDYIENDFRWAVKDVPAFKAEPFMTTAKDYISKINFELSHTQYPNQPPKFYRGTWENLNDEFLKNEFFGQALQGSGFLNRIVEAVTAGMNSPSEKAAAIYSFVKQKVEWNGAYTKYAANDFKKVLDEKKGSCAEINLLLVAMLLKAGIQASPVLISTRDHGFVREQISISSQFNYVIASMKMEGKTVLLDATGRSLPMNILPERCLNGQGYIVAKEGQGWISLTPASKSHTTTTIDLALDVEGGLKGKINFSRDGYDAQVMRKKYFSRGETDYLKDLAGSHSWELHKSEFENVKEISEPVKETHELTIAEHTQTGGGAIYLNPLLIHRMEENPFKAEQRLYPVDFGSPFEQLYTGKIVIPDGLVIEELPKPKVLVLPGNSAKYVYNVSHVGNFISITSQMSINRSLFSQDEYANLREFYSQVVAKQAEQVVLKKK